MDFITCICPSLNSYYFHPFFLNFCDSKNKQTNKKYQVALYTENASDVGSNLTVLPPNAGSCWWCSGPKAWSFLLPLGQEIPLWNVKSSLYISLDSGNQNKSNSKLTNNRKIFSNWHSIVFKKKKSKLSWMDCHCSNMWKNGLQNTAGKDVCFY